MFGDLSTAGRFVLARERVLIVERIAYLQAEGHDAYYYNRTMQAEVFREDESMSAKYEAWGNGELVHRSTHRSADLSDHKLRGRCWYDVLCDGAADSRLKATIPRDRLERYLSQFSV